VARAIHQGSLRASGPYIRVSCAALPPALIESEMFGHEKGSVTWTLPDNRGAMEPLLSLAELGQHHIQRALQKCHGRISGRGGAAELLQIHPNTLRTRMEKFGITRFPD
jgi:DNA-binding NtrC family response regulator